MKKYILFSLAVLPNFMNCASQELVRLVGKSNLAIGTSSILGSCADKCYTNMGIGSRTLSVLEEGYENLAIGHRTGYSLKTGSNNIYIGANVEPDKDSESETTRIGSAQKRCFVTGIHKVAPVGKEPQVVIIDENGQLGTISFEELKKLTSSPIPSSTLSKFEKMLPQLEALIQESIEPGSKK